MSKKSAANSALLTDIFPYPKFWWLFSKFIPFRRWKRKFQFEVLADWKLKYDELIDICPELKDQKFRVDTTGGFVVGFHFPIQNIFIKVHKSPRWIQSFDKEKEICDKIIHNTVLPDIQIPQIQVIKSLHFTYSISQYISGKPIKFFSKRLQKKFAVVIAEDLAYAIYSMITGAGVLHSDMCGYNIKIDYKTGHVIGIIDWGNTIEVDKLENVINSDFLEMFDYLSLDIRTLMKTNLLSYMMTHYQKKQDRKQNLLV